ncbi:hypothetical protein [Thermoflavimicrobium daqui]|uniref:Uncharacterized protein n=1 Tax=Thermoflavimicrobium daqui TaxID=2137476 RepID=A0A364K1K8_9BACL|nr:hypothetical protein [Thermoflavimicrobium daqui]RAL21473.1 hypothetical protein DL897_16080 [Thermoflavimicrobium daqui]
MTYFQLGSLSIPATWLAVSIALLTASFMYRVLTGTKVGEWYWNSFILYFFVWKLSYILFHFNLFVNMPLSILYFNGGTKGHIVALITLSLYLLFIAVKKNSSIYEESTCLFLLYLIGYEVIFHLLEKNGLEAAIHLILFTCYLLLFTSLKKKKGLLSYQMFLLWILLELLIISYFHTIFSMEAFTFIWAGVTVLILSKKAGENT